MLRTTEQIYKDRWKRRKDNYYEEKLHNRKVIAFLISAAITLLISAFRAFKMAYGF